MKKQGAYGPDFAILDQINDKLAKYHLTNVSKLSLIEAHKAATLSEP